MNEPAARARLPAAAPAPRPARLVEGRHHATPRRHHQLAGQSLFPSKALMLAMLAMPLCLCCLALPALYIAGGMHERARTATARRRPAVYANARRMPRVPKQGPMHAAQWRRRRHCQIRTVLLDREARCQPAASRGRPRFATPAPSSVRTLAVRTTMRGLRWWARSKPRPAV